MKVLAIIAVLLLHVHLAQSQLGCKFGANDVDWFLLYKPPAGDDAFHLVPGDGQLQAAAPMNDAATGLSPTITPFLNPNPAANKQTYVALAYSNYGPKFRKPISLTPSKGLILIGATAAPFSSWIVHTIPKFPDISGAALAYTAMPGTALALCMTINNDAVPKILEVLTYSDVILYDEFRGNNLAAGSPLENPLSRAFMNGDIPQQSPFVKVHQFTTVGGALGAGAVPVIVVGKYQAANVDIFSRYAALVLKVPLKVRFDTTSRDTLPNHCVIGNPTSNLPGVITIGGQQIDARDEGAVWAVDNAQKNYFCITNAPRTTKLQSLGSTVTCIQAANVYTIFDAAAKSIPNLSLCP